MTIKTVYTGGLRTQATHLQSGATITTDAPTDNHGKGEAFSPTDLMCAALGSCMLTIMGIAADAHGFSIDGTSVEITKMMNAAPRRVGEIAITFNFPPNGYTDKQKRFIEAAVATCPVGMSLHPELKQTVIYKY